MECSPGGGWGWIADRVVLHRAPVDEGDVDLAVHRLDLGWGEEGGGGAGGSTDLPQPGGIKWRWDGDCVNGKRSFQRNLSNWEERIEQGGKKKKKKKKDSCLGVGAMQGGTHWGFTPDPLPPYSSRIMYDLSDL